RPAEALERELSVEQLGEGRGALEISVGLLQLPGGKRGSTGPIIALGLDLQRAAAAGISVVHPHRARRPVQAVERNASGEPGQAGVIVTDTDRLLADLGPGRQSVAEVPG